MAHTEANTGLKQKGFYVPTQWKPGDLALNRQEPGSLAGAGGSGTVEVASWPSAGTWPRDNCSGVGSAGLGLRV